MLETFLSAPIPQERLRAELDRAIAKLVARTDRAAEGLAPTQLFWRPPRGGWSVAEVFEHLVLANESYLVRVRALLSAAAPPAAPPGRWRASLAGGLLVRSFASRRRFPAPRLYRPGPAPRAHVLAAFAGTLRELARLMESAAPLDWRRVRTTSPVARIVRINLGDCFVIVVRHAERHFRQIERLRVAWQAARLSGTSAGT